MRCLNTVLFTLLLILLNGTAWGEVSTRTVQAEATGIDREQAIFNALGDAVRQVHGARVDASREIRSHMQRLSIRDDQGREASIQHEARVESGTQVQSQGLISGYRVLQVSPAAGGGQRVRLEVQVPVYRTPGKDAQGNRRRIAVYPVEVEASDLRLGEHTPSAREASHRLTQAIVRALVSSRRFSVLERDMQQAIEEEQRFVATGRVPVAEKAMLGRRLGADYLLTARLTGMDMRTIPVTNRITGETARQGEGMATLEARIVIPATGQIMWAHTLNTHLEDLGIDPEAHRALPQRVYNALGNELVFQAVDVIYPLRVVESRGETIVLNQGGTLVQPGQRWAVYDVGRAYSDPYHGEDLAHRETWCAEVEITHVTERIARARVVKGTVEGNGQVLRRIAPASADPKEAEREAQRGTRKRICLPMDPC
ncbi:CsgG/HfaB family protein [Ectothiorhodospira mobilis]|uniref:CsgG/HfaB family protein n=1 Tax=Ectothiorhodospira mobilis TaxID=195064 RepID=UPI001907EC69|nr:CsgG/HfaB family protein [Ectothiorhodospira mobilis]